MYSASFGASCKIIIYGNVSYPHANVRSMDHITIIMVQYGRTCALGTNCWQFLCVYIATE